MPPVQGLVGWRTSVDILSIKAGRVSLRVHGWDLSNGPIEVAAADIGSDVLSGASEQQKLTCWVEQQPDGNLKLSDYRLPYESPC